MMSNHLFNQQRNPSTHQRGITAVEAAIVAPLFFLLLFVILDGARMIYAYGTVAHAAREGVRYAVVRGAEAGEDLRRAGDAPTTSTKVEAYVTLRARPLKGISVTTTWEQNGNLLDLSAGKVVKVLVEHDFSPVTPFLPNLTLSSTSSTVIYF
ncbi:TadE-like protein [Shewanella piezotolerans WP3]|uniref:TadE-like protein n=1 Tax=Shewanella piezotolerans (strain WP3 / JCM 13877) TaxID=225849 RepID=B8CHX4_SHEPW|nr:TadE/TadG family type IV pilus assembly protein [Shewanella piezotolerans]ACJ27250.1 TadE-like protein [Shewanella piezotolerans WP3]